MLVLVQTPLPLFIEVNGTTSLINSSKSTALKLMLVSLAPSLEQNTAKQYLPAM